MGRGGDLTSNERTTIVGMNKTRFKNYDKKQINRGNIKAIMKLRATSGVTCGKAFVKVISQEMKRHEEFNNTIFVVTGQVSRLDFSPNKALDTDRILSS
jgi:hypothetical protein